MRRLALVLILFCLLTLTACGGRNEPAQEAESVAAETAETPETPEDAGYYHEYLPEKPPGADGAAEQAPDEDLSPEEAAEREQQALAARREEQLHTYLSGMTTEEKVGQLFFVQCTDGSMADAIAQYHLGGVLLFTSDYKNSSGGWLSAEAFSAKLETFQTAAAYDTGIPLFIGSDEEGGTVTRASRNPNLFPEKSKSPQELYAAGGMGAILNDAAQKSYILRSLGINVNFAPVCDVSTDPNDFIYARSFGKNAAETMAYVTGVELVMGDAGMGSVLKHFPGYGNNVDTHTGIAVDERPIETFRSSDFLPFLAGIRANTKVAPFVLVSHNIVTCMDPDLPASLSPAVHRLLREELGFDGVILTDDLSMSAVKAYAKNGEVAVQALRAGNDMLVTADFASQIAQVLDAVADGTLDESVIDEACLRVLRAKSERFPMPWETEDAA